MFTNKDLKMEAFKKTFSLLSELFRDFENYQLLTTKNKTEFDLHFSSTEIKLLKWNKHYLTNRHYRLFKLLHSFPWISSPNKSIPPQIYKFAIKMMDKWALKITSDSNNENREKPTSFFMQFILSRGIAFYFDALSTAQNGKIIGDLLNEFLETSNVKSLTDAMKVDPSVEHIPKIKKHIESLPIKKNLEFRTKSKTSIQKPLLSPDVRRIHIEAPMFLHYAAISGLLKEPYSLTNNELFSLAQELEVLPSHKNVNTDYLNDLITYFRTL